MIFKSRTVPEELVILKTLKKRIELNKVDQQTYNNLQKGFEGELLFDSLMERLESDYLVLNDLLLKVNNQTFQIDSLVIMNHVVYLLEIKNFSDVYLFKSEKLFQREQTETTNPLIQLNRSESLLSQLLLKLNFNIPIQGFVIFINPEFTLYLAPPNVPYILPSQINLFVKKLNSHRLKIQEQHKKLAEHLLSLHITDNLYQRFPSYQYQQLRKGIPCPTCLSFTTTIIGKKCICTFCGNSELVESAVVRNVREFKILFPEEKITTRKIRDWCEIIDSKKRILRILKKNFTQIDTNQRTYFE